MDHERLESPLLHQDIYRKDALNTVLSWYHATYRTAFAITAEPRGWRLRLMDAGTFGGKDKVLLWEVMNAILVQSIETRLAGVTR